MESPTKNPLTVYTISARIMDKSMDNISKNANSKYKIC